MRACWRSIKLSCSQLFSGLKARKVRMRVIALDRTIARVEATLGKNRKKAMLTATSRKHPAIQRLFLTRRPLSRAYLKIFSPVLLMGVVKNLVLAKIDIIRNNLCIFAAD